MICPPLYLGLFLGKNILNIIQPTPFIHAFITLILLPLLAAIFTQDWSISFKQGVHIIHLVACTFNSHYAFAVIASQISRLYYDVILLTEVLPIYVLFVLITPFIAYALALISTRHTSRASFNL